MLDQGLAGVDPIVVGAALVLLAVLGRLLRPRRPRPAAPQRGEVWFAMVPFRDGTGAKDRPVLVLDGDGPACTVVRFTSRDRDARRDHARLPVPVRGLHGDSWVDLRPMPLPRSAFRRRVAAPDEALVSWYHQQAEPRGLAA